MLLVAIVALSIPLMGFSGRPRWVLAWPPPFNSPDGIHGVSSPTWRDVLILSIPLMGFRKGAFAERPRHLLFQFP